MAWERVVGAIGRARVPLPVVIAIVICAGLALWSARIESVASGAPPLRGPAITPAQNECDLEACKKWTECEPVAACPVSPPCPVAVPVICPTTAMVAAPLVTISPAYSVAPLAGTPRLLLDTISAVHDAANSQGAVQTVALTAGNAAMNLMIKNWAASIRRLQPPLPHLVVPLDNSGLEQLKSAIVPINLFQESAALSRFQAGGSNYGESIYAEMSAYKWRFALKLLEAGVPVLLADPDVVFLRNPVPYIVRSSSSQRAAFINYCPAPSTCDPRLFTAFVPLATAIRAQSTLPQCDVHMQIDVDYPSTGESIRAKNGWEYVGVRDFYCGGFAHLRPTVAGIAHLRYFLAQIGARASVLRAVRPL